MNGLRLSKIFILLAIFFLTLIFFSWVVLPGDRAYTKLNFIYYNMYTFDEVKKINFISDDYTINYRFIDGNANESNDVFFFNVDPEKNIELIDNLSENGFISEYDDFYNEERWVKGNIKIKITIDEKARATSLFVEKS